MRLYQVLNGEGKGIHYDWFPTVDWSKPVDRDALRRKQEYKDHMKAREDHATKEVAALLAEKKQYNATTR